MKIALRILAPLFVAILFSVPAMAAQDARMQVQVTAEEGESIDLQGAIEQAAAIMWDRILPQREREKVKAAAAASLLMRAVPGDNSFEIDFQPARVWQYIDAQNMAAIREEPAFNLQLHMQNEYGMSMQGSEATLRQQAGEIARHWGIILREKAPLLELSWQWLGSEQVQLNIRGNSRFPEQSETRTVPTDDAMQAMQKWLQEILLKARDAYAEQKTDETTSRETTRAVGSEMSIHITRTSSLPEQVLFEDALRHDRRVLLLQPHVLSGAEREYILRLETSDDSWLPSWFRQHGMTATATPYGWLVE
jgi:hypothetical protein